jgi:ribosome-binding protein aMBF1 (putative translation factor)
MKLKSFLEEDTGLICDKCGSRVDKKDAITVKKNGKEIALCKKCYEKYKKHEEEKNLTKK